MKNIIPILLLIFSFGCQKSEKSTYAIKSDITQQHPGKKLMEMQCYVCHNPATPHESRIAPPMIAIKNHYYKNGISKENFVKEIQNFVKNPSNESSKMPGAVKKFGLMPKQYFSESAIRQIAEYIYDNEMEKPVGFDENHKNMNGKGNGNGNGKGNMNRQNNQGNLNVNPTSNQEKGLQIALATKAVLGKNLMGKIQKEGTLAALDFCHVKAIPLTDSMSVAKNVTIKRASDKPRNPKNKATSSEEIYIKLFKEDIKNGKDSEPIVVENGNHVNVYYPITTNSMCLQCHGTPKTQVKENVLTGINKNYPNDKAIGYDINQVRGIWNVSFNK